MKHNNINKLSNDPLSSINWIYKYFNQNVPQIATRPTLQEYNLPDNIHDILEKEEKKIKKITISILISIYIIGFILMVVFLLNNQSNIFEAIFTVIFSYGWIAMIILAESENSAEEIVKNIISLVTKNKEITVLRERYSKFIDATYAYFYWEKMTNINYWLSLDGHQFEDAVAAVYRTNGYIARVSKHGGDGGVDITLRKNGKTIAVQCKAHKKEIGPSVARDLYGTISHLGMDEGIIVSRSGFTSGVHDFVKGKPIELVTLNDLMDIQSSIISSESPKQSKAQKTSDDAVDSDVPNTQTKVKVSVKTTKKKKSNLTNDNTVQLTFEDMNSFSNSTNKPKENTTIKHSPKTIPTTSNHNLPQVDIGTKVSHKSWGEGSIVSKGISTFVVDFNGTEMKFTYPISFQNGTLTIK